MKRRSTASIPKAWYTGRLVWLQGQERPGPIQASGQCFPEQQGRIFVDRPRPGLSTGVPTRAAAPSGI